jgi:F-type H+-transporting ATPase subunit b
MHIDWWTLALQTANVLILIWLLAHFLFRPVADIVTRRQDEANKLLADAAGVRRQADAARADLERAHSGIAGERDNAIAEARAAAEAERAALLAKANEEMAKLRADAEAAIVRDRRAMERTLIDRARDLAVDIARRLLGRVGPATGVDAFLAGLCAQVKALPPQERAAFMQTQEGDDIEIVTAASLDADAIERIRRAVAEAFTGDNSGKPALVFRTDPAVIAGIELNSRHAVIRNSWRNDLERICEELDRTNGPAKQTR